jgi:hypothetical protein
MNTFFNVLNNRETKDMDSFTIFLLLLNLLRFLCKPSFKVSVTKKPLLIVSKSKGYRVSAATNKHVLAFLYNSHFSIAKIS